jgi:hypothetical protein
MPIDARKFLYYRDGSLIESEPPSWFTKHLETAEDDWEKSLRARGVSEIEKFGDVGDALTIYRSRDGYYVEYLDLHEIAAHIFIENVNDYLHFRVHWIKPLAELIIFSDKLEGERVNKG